MKEYLRIKGGEKGQQPKVLYISADRMHRVNWRAVKRLGFEVQTEFPGVQVSEEFVNKFPHLVVDGLSTKVLEPIHT